MPFIKVLKNKAYFKRFQTKYRRRREGKTDYYARKRLVMQDKNKYQTPKYRLVVRFTNTQVICQVVYSEISGDKTLAAAYSKELKTRYGAKAGLKNYAAAYATGLLVARRALSKLKLADIYEGNTEVTGEVISSEEGKKTFYVAEVDDKKRPFRVLLDVGLRPTSQGCRLFGALKGANDGGLDIPHNEKRFPGYDTEDKKYNPEMHRDKIFGNDVAEYMRGMEEDEPEKFQAHFSEYIKGGVGADDIEGMWESVHAAIRADPLAKVSDKTVTHNPKYKRPAKRHIKQRKDRVKQKKASALAKRLAAMEAEG